MNPGRNKSGARRNAIVSFAFFAFLLGASLTADRLQSHVSARPTIAASQGQDKASTAAKDQTDAEAAAAEIPEKHIAALGGREAYKSIKSVEQEIEQEAFGVVSKVYSIRERKHGISTSARRAQTGQPKQALMAPESGRRRHILEAI